MTKTISRSLALAVVVACACLTSAQAVLIASYNETATPNRPDSTLWPYSIGWLWEPADDFYLDRIETRFDHGDRLVTIAVYDGLPHQGGILLGSAAYNSVGGTWGGVDLVPIHMAAGSEYLIAFLNVSGLGPSFAPGEGEQFSTDALAHFDNDGLAAESFVVSSAGLGDQDNAIIKIYGEPSAVPDHGSTFILLGGVLAGLCVFRRKLAGNADAPPGVAFEIRASS